jgi:hypothetical protein
MNDYVCLARRFPAVGVDGVLGVPVTNHAEIGEYLEALPVPVGEDKVKFVRLTAIPERSRGHLKVGDVVVKYNGLSERFLDILRPVETAQYNTNFRSGEIDWDLAEQARQEAFETGKWSLTHDKSQVAICDPEGNLAVLRAHKGTPRTLFKYAYAVFLDTDQDKERITYNPYKQYDISPVEKPKWAWATFRFMHFWIFKHGPVVEKGKWHNFKKAVKKHHEAIQQVPTPEIGDYLRLHTRRNNKRSQEFWRRVRVQYADDQDSVPRALAFVASKNEVRWVRVRVSELDELFRCAEWSEWSDLGPPFHFSTFQNKEMVKWN